MMINDNVLQNTTLLLSRATGYALMAPWHEEYEATWKQRHSSRIPLCMRTQGERTTRDERGASASTQVREPREAL